MGASLWDQVWLPLLIGVARSIVFAALCFLGARLWNFLVQQITTHTTGAGESVHTQPLSESDAATHANGVPDLEMGNGSGPSEGGEPELELGIVKGGEVGERDHNQLRPVGDADDANALPDLEVGTGNGGEDGESKVLPNLDVGMANGGEGEVLCGSALEV